MNNESDFKAYTLDELQDSYSNMDTSKHPDIAKKILAEIQLRLTHHDTLDSQLPTKKINSSEYTTPKGNWFKLHWQGSLTLEVSYWLNVFAVGFVLAIISPSLFQYLADSEASPEARGLSIIAFYVLITGLSIWQLTGLYRSADKHPKRGGSIGWALLAKLMVLIGICRYCYDMSTTGVPFILASSQLVVGSSDLPPLSLRVMNQGTEVELSGGFDFGASVKLAEVLADNPNIKTIHLNSVGGRIIEAKKLALMVKNNNLVTYSKTECLSACPIVFLAGKARLLAEEAKLGFHSASFGGVSGSDIAELNSELLALYEQAKVPDFFVKKVAKINANDMWKPSTDELIRAGIVDKIVDSGNYALSGVSDWRNPTTLDSELQKHELYQNLKKFDHQGYEIIRDSMVVSIKDGTPLNTVTANTNDYLYVERLNYYMQLAGDAEVIQYMQSQVKQMEYLQNEYPEKCAYYTYPDVFDSNLGSDISSLLPSDISNQESLAFNALIKSLNPNNGFVNQEEQTRLITIIVEKIIALDVSYSDVLSNPEKYQEEPSKLCTVGILLNKEINLLPEAQAGPLLRSFYVIEQ